MILNAEDELLVSFRSYNNEINLFFFHREVIGKSYGPRNISTQTKYPKTSDNPQRNCKSVAGFLKQATIFFVCIESGSFLHPNTSRNFV